MPWGPPGRGVSGRVSLPQGWRSTGGVAMAPRGQAVGSKRRQLVCCGRVAESFPVVFKSSFFSVVLKDPTQPWHIPKASSENRAGLNANGVLLGGGSSVLGTALWEERV